MATINLGAIKFNWKGAYNSSTTYAVDDVVSSGGNSYVCIQAHSNQAVGNATAYWNIMSSAGTNGTDGTDLTSTLTTRGDIVYKGASALTRLPKGTAGYYLKQGANDPEWGEVASGDYVKLAGGNLTSGNSVNIDGYFTNTYDYFKLFIDGETNWTKCRFRFGSTTHADNYVWCGQYGQRSNSATAESGIGGWNADHTPITYWNGDGSNEHHHAEVTITKPWDTSGYSKNIFVNAWDYNSTEVHNHVLSAFLDGQYYTTAMTGVHLFCAGGNFSDFSWKLYGIKS